ncbi:MAG: hypothetical protein H7174_11355 [Flavobacterium sp.]|nr:hypothetical protein [Flavobacterium sp.]
MKENKAKLNLTYNGNFCNPSFSMIYKNESSQNGFMEFDIFLFSNSFQEKLPIIYANIRV